MQRQARHHQLQAAMSIQPHRLPYPVATELKEMGFVPTGCVAANTFIVGQRRITVVLILLVVMPTVRARNHAIWQACFVATDSEETAHAVMAPAVLRVEIVAIRQHIARIRAAMDYVEMASVPVECVAVNPDIVEQLRNTVKNSKRTNLHAGCEFIHEL